MKCRSAPKNRATPSSTATASSFLSIARARIICAARPWITATASPAPAGEFLTSKQVYDRYIAMSPTELTTVNAELIRNYIRNFQQVRGLVPYVVGRFNIMEAHELTPNDVFMTGMVALTNAVDHGELLM